MDALRKILADRQADAVLLSFLPDIRWACGFSGSNGLLLVTREQAQFISDGRYKAQARREVKNADVYTPGYNLLEYMEKEGWLDHLDRVIFQSDHVTVDQLNSWKQHYDHVEWLPEAGLLQEHVARKRSDEIAAMRRAQRITDSVFEDLLDFIQPGMTEKEIAAFIIYEHLKRGAEKMSFDPIVASGSNGSLPHARPSTRQIDEGEMIVIDMGCFADGYASDMTRTVALGDPGKKAKLAYEAVLSAQKEAIAAAKSGMTGKELDSVARSSLDGAGYAQHFTHGLGHGVGLQVHEWPKLSYHVEHLLPEGVAVTIEPGVYIPEEFGVRIEDILILNASGSTNLTSSPKELIVI